MLSIIVSSYQTHYFDKFTENVKKTIGNDFVYEIIQIWNPGLMGICEAYNKGANQAKYENVLFVHEDVLFETENWGEILVKLLYKENIGCVGVAGSTVKTRFPIAWWDLNDYKHLHIRQLNNNDNEILYQIPKNIDAKILDGVFLAVKKSNWKDNKFNEINKEFHGYDVEFTLNLSKKYNNLITNEILITHFSNGNISKKWFLELIRIYKFNKEYSTKDSLIEIKLFFNYFRKLKFSKGEIFKYFILFYNPLKFSLKNNLRIYKMLYFHLK